VKSSIREFLRIVPATVALSVACSSYNGSTASPADAGSSTQTDGGGDTSSVDASIQVADSSLDAEVESGTPPVDCGREVSGANGFETASILNWTGYNRAVRAVNDNPKSGTTAIEICSGTEQRFAGAGLAVPAGLRGPLLVRYWIREKSGVEKPVSISVIMVRQDGSTVLVKVKDILASGWGDPESRGLGLTETVSPTLYSSVSFAIENGSPKVTCFVVDDLEVLELPAGKTAFPAECLK
jgi:hypothetical protein